MGSHTVTSIRITNRISSIVVFAALFSTTALAAQPVKPAAPAKTPPVVQPAPSQPGLSDASRDDPAKVAAAREFILRYRPRMNPLNISVKIQHIMPMLVERAKEENPKLDVKKYVETTRAQMMQQAAKALDHQAHVLSRHFTVAELKELTAFFRTPVGEKLAAETPKIQREILLENRQARMEAMAARGKATKVQTEDEDEEDSSQSLTRPKNPKR